MPLNVIKDIRKIVSGLNAQDIRTAAARDISIGLLASSEDTYRDMEDFLAPRHLDHENREQSLRMVHRLDQPQQNFDFFLCEPGIGLPRNGYLFDNADHDAELIDCIVSENPALELPLARAFPPFRRAVAHRIISRVSRENAMLALVTALPNVIPNIIELPWAVGEFATDTAFLTMNQIRMALMMAAVYDRPVGYAEQKASIAAIAAGAFGWRAIARELVGKIPLGGGLIPKGAIAFAGTWVVGTGLEKFYRTGKGFSRHEERETFKGALTTGRQVASEFDDHR